MLTLREFHGEEYYKWCRQEYDIARHFLKTCGRPNDWYDKYLIEEARKTEAFFRKYVVDK